jgi:hypothetical protein
VKILSRSWTPGPFKEEMPSKHDCTSELDAEEEIKRERSRRQRFSSATSEQKARHTAG